MAKVKVDKEISLMKFFLLWPLAYFRLNRKAICAVSAGMGLVDYHDYTDSEIGEPLHFYKYSCKHCGKEFYI